MLDIRIDEGYSGNVTIREGELALIDIVTKTMSIRHSNGEIEKIKFDALSKLQIQ